LQDCNSLSIYTKTMRSKYTIITLVILSQLIVNSASAQWHDAHWWKSRTSDFVQPGVKAVIINTKDPDIPFRSIPYKEDGAAPLAMSDSSGQLLFYSNLGKVFNLNNQIMENGDSLGYTPELWWNKSIIGSTVPRGSMCLPLDHNRYALFHFRRVINNCPNAYFISEELLMTIVDMNYNNGLGKVTSKNNLIKSCAQGSLRMVSATRHANGRDWWVLVSFRSNNNIFSFQFDPSGEVHNSSTAYFASPDTLYFFQGGDDEFSPDGSKYIICGYERIPRVYEFDRCTGQLNKHQEIIVNDSVGQPIKFVYAAVSPNSKYLYLIGFEVVYQFDLTADTIQNTAVLLMTYDGYYQYQSPTLLDGQTTFSDMQLFPNGKIYGITLDVSNYMHVINYPDRPGLSCEALQRGVRIPTALGSYMAYYPNYRLGPIDGSACDTLGIDNQPKAYYRYDVEDTILYNQVTFTDLSYYEPATWTWDFGDGATSTEQNPVHAYTQDSTYTVCLTVSNTNGSHTHCEEVAIKAPISSTEPTPTNTYWQVSAYPNPTQTDIFVSISGDINGRLGYKCYDILGKVIKTGTLNPQGGMIPMSELWSGTYILHITDQTGQQRVLRIVKR
jgi:PKD repeat protein